MAATTCFVCGEPATTTLGIRARYGKQKDAHWAPELGAYLCNLHAKSGCDIQIIYAPTASGNVRVKTRLAGGPVVSLKVLPIGGNDSGQGTLI